MVKVEIQNRILLQWDGENFKCIGPLELLESVEQLRSKYGADPKNWSALDLQRPHKSVDLVLYKFIQKVKRLWSMPYKHEELCHCRLVPTEKVTQAIEQGCDTVMGVARVTLAGTGCGTCRSDTEELIQFYNFK